MCLNHRNIITRSKRLDFSPFTQFKLAVPCGNCCECKSMKYNEYLFRSYFHALSCRDSGGFVLFDTLTYSDQHLPHLSSVLNTSFKEFDFPCFSRQDLRLFFVRLRRSLARDGYDVVNNLSYFLTSEYGTADTGTHRPHYHVLFFVSFDIEPTLFSKYVSAAWYHGRTDGIKYHSATYVLNHVFGRGSLSHEPLIKLVNYVCKYVNKSSQFKEQVIKRINLYLSNECADFSQSQIRDTRNHLYYLCSEFHLQSKGFGLSALSYVDVDEVKENGYFRFLDPVKVVRTLPIPVYFQRKLFYQLVEDFRGVLHWELTEEGNKFKRISSLRSVDTFVTKFTKWYMDLNGESRLYVDSVLNGRSITDFVHYLLFYKGRLKPANLKIEPLDEWAVKIFSPTEWSVYNYTDKKEFGHSLIAFNWFGDRKTESFRPVNFRKYKSVFCDCCEFEQHYVINQSSLKEFNGYDDLFSFYSLSCEPLNVKKERTSLYRDRLRLLFH